MIKLSTKNITAWVVSLHDHNHWTPSTLWLYGKEVINIQSSIASGTWRRYQVEPTEVNHVNQVNNPCISDESNSTIIGDCVIDHVLSGLNCNLPWRMKNINYPLCSSSDEYDHFWSKSRKAMDHNTYYVEKEAKCTPGCRRVEYSWALFVACVSPTFSSFHLEILIPNIQKNIAVIRSKTKFLPCLRIVMILRFFNCFTTLNFQQLLQ